jgi:hypothetical protein
MGTPALIKSREMQCVGAGEPISRPMTEEEMLKYSSIKPLGKKPAAYIMASEFTDLEVEEMKGVKINPPEKEKLLDTLGEIQGKTKAIYHAAKVFKISSQTIYNWMKGYGIEFDDSGKVIRERVEVTSEQEEATTRIESEAIKPEEEIQANEESESVVTEYLDSQIQKLKKVVDESFTGPGGIITIAGQETEKKYYTIGYAEYDIGSNILVKIDFRQELIKIDNENQDMTFSEVEAIVDLLNDIL